MDRRSRPRPLIRIVGHDADDISEQLRAKMFPARVRPLGEDADFYIEIAGYASGPVLYFDGIFPGGAIFEKDAGAGFDGYTLFIPWEGSILLKGGPDEVRCTPETAGFGESPAFPHIVYSARNRFTVIAIEHAEMVRQLSDLIERPVARPFGFASSFDLTQGAGATIRAAARALQVGLEGPAPLLQSPIAMRRMNESVIALLLEGVPHRFSHELRAPVAGVSPYYVKRAIEFMWANASRPISAADIAGECGVSVRALNSGFRGFKGAPMMAYLREIRLSAVRQELRDPASTASIAAIAQKWGFTHFGRFSNAYEKRYGELPSHTRRRLVGAGPGGL